MATINEIKQQAEAVKNATQVGENTAERVGGALAGLADIAKQQDVELGKKADKETVNTELGKKADKTYMDTELGKKANTADVNTKFTEEKKRVDAELAKNEVHTPILLDCDNIHYASTNSLTSGAINSGGCLRSKGEQKINALLFDHGVNYQTQFWFKDLKDKKYLYFDFAIINDDNSIKCLVEYQGIQHYDPNILHGSWKNLPQIHDQMKRDYCKKNNITLIEIPYYDFDIIDWEYLKNKLGL